MREQQAVDPQECAACNVKEDSWLGEEFKKLLNSLLSVNYMLIKN